MNDWKSELEQALQDFIKVADLAHQPIHSDDLNTDFLDSPHNPPSSLHRGKMALYGFYYEGEWLKIGRAGPKSHARYTSQHYNENGARSSLAKSLKEDSSMKERVGDDPGEWIKRNCNRVNILIDINKHSLHLLALMEAFLHARFNPRYEGGKSIGQIDASRSAVNITPNNKSKIPEDNLKGEEKMSDLEFHLRQCIKNRLISMGLEDAMKYDEDIEILPAPHEPTRLPKGKMAVLGFWYDGKCMMIGRTGPKSVPRYEYQHYHESSAPSTFAGSLLKDTEMRDIVGPDPEKWIKNNCTRVNILIDAKYYRLPNINLLESLEYCIRDYFSPRY